MHQAIWQSWIYQLTAFRCGLSTWLTLAAHCEATIGRAYDRKSVLSKVWLPPECQLQIHSPEFKARIAMETNNETRTLQEIVAASTERMIEECQWMKEGMNATPGRPRGTSSVGRPWRVSQPASVSSPVSPASPTPPRRPSEWSRRSGADRPGDGANHGVRP